MNSNEILLAIIVVAILFLVYKKHKSAKPTVSATTTAKSVVGAVSSSSTLMVPAIIGVAVPSSDVSNNSLGLMYKTTPACSLEMENGANGEYCDHSQITDSYDREQYTKWLRDDVGKEFFQ